jgi:hypothetical protein
VAAGDLITLSYATDILPGMTAQKLNALPALITAASDAIRDYCKRDFFPITLTELYDGDGTTILLLNLYPVTSIASITTGMPDNPDVMDPATYGFKSKTGEVRINSSLGFDPFIPSDGWGFSGRFPSGWQNIQVVYSAGLSSVPTPVQQACVQVVSALWDYARRDNSIDGERWEDYSTSRNPIRKDFQIPDTAKDLLATYRDYRV